MEWAVLKQKGELLDLVVADVNAVYPSIYLSICLSTYLGELLDQKADLVVADITITYEREQEQ